LSEQTDIAINKAAAYQLAGIQLIFAIVITLLLFVFLGKVPAYSALLGGLAYILPNAYFVRCAFRGSGEQSPHKIVRWFYVGEAGKLILTGVIFAICFALVKPLHVITLFIAYILMIVINGAGLALNK
jgi:ATP synthase protein I